MPAQLVMIVVMEALDGASLMVRFIRSTCPFVHGWFILVSLCSMPFSSQTRSKMWWNAYLRRVSLCT